ncbi:DUF624 domain-containing protein [Paenarthrobacter sp. FR1]|uniref:DUF624 domain-containing protein n=1 Tax=Paenarthrobacter sp. FR1 TaxID=3439548 RepID=UPI003DA5474A
MKQQKRRPRGTALLAALDVVGDMLILQLLFLVTSLPLITVVPAAIALQRALQKTVLEDRPGVARAFMREFSWAWNRVGKISWPAPFVVAAAAFSILFWLSTPGALGAVALCVIIPLCGILAAGYIALLVAAMKAEDGTTRQGLTDLTLRIILSKPLPLAGCVIALATWLLLMLRVPTLIPLGSGLVPAMLAWLMVRKAPNTESRVSG